MPCVASRRRFRHDVITLRKRRSTHVRESNDFATLRSKFEKPKIAPDPASVGRSFPSQPIHIPTTHPDIPLWCTNVSPITTGTTPSIPIRIWREMGQMAGVAVRPVTHLSHSIGGLPCDVTRDVGPPHHDIARPSDLACVYLCTMSFSPTCMRLCVTNRGVFYTWMGMPLPHHPSAPGTRWLYCV